jgi:hypothetical protein
MKVTLKQVEYIQRLTARPWIGVLRFDDISERLGKDIWDLDSKEASKLIQQLETVEGLHKFLEK